MVLSVLEEHGFAVPKILVLAAMLITIVVGVAIPARQHTRAFVARMRRLIEQELAIAQLS